MNPNLITAGIGLLLSMSLAVCFGILLHKAHKRNETIVWGKLTGKEKRLGLVYIVAGAMMAVSIQTIIGLWIYLIIAL